MNLFTHGASQWSMGDTTAPDVRGRPKWNAAFMRHMPHRPIIGGWAFRPRVRAELIGRRKIRFCQTLKQVFLRHDARVSAKRGIAIVRCLFVRTFPSTKLQMLGIRKVYELENCVGRVPPYSAAIRQIFDRLS